MNRLRRFFFKILSNEKTNKTYKEYKIVGKHAKLWIYELPTFYDKMQNIKQRKINI